MEILQQNGVSPSEKLRPLGVTGARLRAPLKAPIHHGTMMSKGLRGLKLHPIIPRGVSLDEYNSGLAK